VVDGWWLGRDSLVSGWVGILWLVGRDSLVGGLIRITNN